MVTTAQVFCTDWPGRLLAIKIHARESRFHQVQFEGQAGPLSPLTYKNRGHATQHPFLEGLPQVHTICLALGHSKPSVGAASLFPLLPKCGVIPLQFFETKSLENFTLHLRWMFPALGVVALLAVMSRWADIVWLLFCCLSVVSQSHGFDPLALQAACTDPVLFRAKTVKVCPECSSFQGQEKGTKNLPNITTMLLRLTRKKP